MLFYALLAFGIAAIGGLILAASVLRGHLAPWALSLVHAALGATGLVLTLLAVLGGVGGYAPIALGVLIIAALGGFFLASFHLRRRPGPKAVVAIHALVAVLGFLTLAGAALKMI
ncbi:MAG: hypothetical protein JSR79_02215 [Proteobacteria bacterium]|nr:hypothetical protein [Pseudomonadota bacterium]